MPLPADENWKITEQLAQPMMVDDVLLYALLYSRRGHSESYAWVVVDPLGRQGRYEFEHPDEGSFEDRLTRRLQALAMAIGRWRDGVDVRPKDVGDA